MKIQVLSLCAVVLTLVLVVFAVAGPGGIRSNGGGNERNETGDTFQGCSGKIEVAGRITSGTGEPLRDVAVVSLSTKHGPGGLLTEKENERVVVDEFFHIVKHDICSLRIDFVKPGFFTVTTDDTVMRGILHVEDVTEMDRIIVLEEMPIPAPMERIEGILKTNAKGPTTAVKLLPGTRDSTPVDNNKAGADDALRGYGVLRIRPRGDGRIESVRRKNQGGMIFEEPTGAYLNSTGPDDGFVLFRPQHEHPIAKRVFREMRVAPKTGYDPDLDFPADAGDRVYFYCLLGGRYGKGFVVRPYLREDDGETTAVSVIKILINPTGDRNVATLD